MLIRLELATPAGDLVSDDTYNKLFTMHGIVMVFFFLIPAIPAVLGNFLVPLMIGAKDLAFPKLNLLSWYIYMLGGAVHAVRACHRRRRHRLDVLHAAQHAVLDTRVIPAALGIFITGFSSILTGLNFIVTIHRMRAPGLTWFRMPLFMWAIYATSLIIVLGTPVIAITLLLVAAERVFHFGIFDPALGGDPVLFQHLFWFYSHPAVYIMVLPAMGVISELVAAFCRKPVFGYSFVAFSSLGIAVLGFLVWGHHMFVAGQSVYASLIFSLPQLSGGDPVGDQGLQLDGDDVQGLDVVADADALRDRLHRAVHDRRADRAVPRGDRHRRARDDTYFIVAHFHYIMVGGTIMGYLGGLHYWWPKISGRMYPEGLAKFAAGIIFIGFNLTFFPQFILGYLGMPRRYHAYPAEFQVLNVLSSAGASILGVGYLLPMIYLVWSLRYGPAAGANPWGASGLEWETTSPPPTENFATTPMVTESPYNYPSPVVKHVA